jgi:acyl CoA:acetate/3-ketoacid CoA transferase
MRVRLGPKGLELIEIAPGVHLERDLLAKMSFRPQIAADLREMDPAIFSRTPLGLAPERSAGIVAHGAPEQGAELLTGSARAAG